MNIRYIICIVLCFTMGLMLSYSLAKADCRGCCSHHGGVICRGGITMCVDGSLLSQKCKAKGCNACSEEKDSVTSTYTRRQNSAPNIPDSAIPSTVWDAKVLTILDGDTLTVKRDRDEITIRLWGIDCPELDQDFGSQAKSFVTRQLSQTLWNAVKVDSKTTDRYGRTVAMVYFSNGKCLNKEIVRAGYAWVYTRYCYGSVCDR